MDPHLHTIQTPIGELANGSERGSILKYKKGACGARGRQPAMTMFCFLLVLRDVPPSGHRLSPSRTEHGGDIAPRRVANFAAHFKACSLNGL
ncbi:hypothetical protein Bpfe_018377 [Biomphalaria pfeifferi]|uniref:Uncharacterized protein n=1 Tax=Biomphalaria pfeifferi TaxID=112525 RepID=A0AAD8F6X7_BIOPF|nr:hypothetical protein Bpfe_018377 [Biomphalaria pfeifferi]